MKRLLAVLVAVRDGFERALIVMLVRFTEGLVVFGGWDRPVTKSAGQVSGDELAWYAKQVRGCPLPNIWTTKEAHGSDIARDPCWPHAGVHA